MPLPTIEQPKYSMEIPSTGKRVEFRPFLVKEEKVLLIAQESGDTKQIIGAMRDIIDACTFGKVKVSILTMYDLEYIFLQLRAKSVGESVEIRVPCPSCTTENIIKVNLNEAKVEEPEEKIESTVEVNKDISLTLRPIQIRHLQVIDGDADDISNLSQILCSIIEAIHDAEGTYNADNYSDQELQDFVDTLPHSAMEQMKDFVENQPTVAYRSTYKCEKCKKEEDIVFEGVHSFFG